MTIAPGSIEDERSGWGLASTVLRIAPFRLLITGQIAGQAADGLLQITMAQVVLFEAGRGATPWEIAKLLVVSLLPFSLIGPFAGVLIDRFDRRRVLVIASVARALVAAGSIAVIALDSQALGYAALLTMLSISRFVLAAKGAALPVTTQSRHLVTANATSSIGGMTAAFFGAVVGATFVAVVPVVGLLAAAAGYAVAAAVFRRLPSVGGGEAAEDLGAGLRRVAAELAEGARFSVQTASVRRPLLAVMGNRLLLGVGFVVLVLVADERYELEAPGYGLAVAGTGVGAFLGTWLAPQLAATLHRRPLLPLMFVVGAVAAVVGAFAPYLVPFVAAVGLAALGFQVIKVLADALIQEAAPDVVRGRVFAIYDMLYNVAFIGAALTLVPLWEPGRESALLEALAVAFVVVGLALAASARTWPFPLRRRGSTRAPHRWRFRFAAAAAGTIPALAFPDANIWPLGFVGLAPALWLVCEAPTAREAGWRGWFAGSGFIAATHQWLVPTTGVFTLPAALLLGVLWVPWALVAWQLLGRRRTPCRLAAAAVFVPATFVVAEYFRSWDRLGGPWGLIGSTQWHNDVILSAAAVGGVWLLSLLLVAANTALAGLLLRRGGRGTRRTAVAAFVAAVAMLAGIGAAGGQGEVVDTMVVAGVQPGVVHDPHARFDAGERLTAQLAGRSLDLVVWAESSVPFDLDGSPEHADRLADLARRVGSPLLVNVDAPRHDGAGIAKAAILVGADGVEARYDKMRLVPFGEYIPLRALLGWIASVSDAAAEDRRPGTDLVVMDVAGHAVGPLVCFESAFPDLARLLAERDTDVIVLQTATTTFQGTWAQPQHAALAALRAVESGRTVVHASVSGVTAAFDPAGNRLLWLEEGPETTWEVTVPIVRGSTLYVRWGDWVPVGAILVLLGGALGVGVRAARRGSPQSGPVSQSDPVPAATAARSRDPGAVPGPGAG